MNNPPFETTGIPNSGWRKGGVCKVTERSGFFGPMAGGPPGEAHPNKPREKPEGPRRAPRWRAQAPSHRGGKAGEHKICRTSLFMTPIRAGFYRRKQTRGVCLSGTKSANVIIIATAAHSSTTAHCTAVIAVIAFDFVFCVIWITCMNHKK